jgi:NADH-quinone oxidoreductase subunit G
MCQVEFKGGDRSWLGVSCRTDAMEGMEVITHSDAAIEARAGVLEFLLANHPLDCPICDKAGECPLQNYTYEHGFTTSRFVDKKRKGEKRKDLGGHIVYDAERCILCTRCVRFMADYAKAPQLMVEGRGDHSKIDIFPNRKLDSAYSGNLADVCPVGALTLDEFRFKVRAWYLTGIESVCPYCSRGCNIFLDVRKNKNRLFRVRPRNNAEVNGYYICNEGRFRPLEAVLAENRLLECTRSGETVSYTAAVEAAAELLKEHEGKVWVVASSRRSVEELYLIARTFGNQEKYKLVAASPDMEEPDGILRTGECAPNVRSLELFGFEQLSLDALGDALAEAKGDGLFMLDAAIDLSAVICDEFKFILYMDFITSGVADRADVAIPGLAWFEKDGAFINGDGRVQRFQKALDPPKEGLYTDLITLATIHRMLHDQEVPSAAPDVFKAAAGEFPSMKGMTYRALKFKGALLAEEGGKPE